MSKVGQILIAHPGLPEHDFFYKSVIFIYSDTSDSTLGLVLNKKSKTSVKEICYSRGVLWPDGITRCHIGGPISPSSLIMLHTNNWSSTNTLEVGKSDYSVTSDDLMFEKMSAGDQPVYWKMCLGVAAWQPGQLQLELNGKFPYRPENSWLMAEPNDSIMFEYEGEDLWIKATELSSRQMLNSYF